LFIIFILLTIYSNASQSSLFQEQKDINGHNFKFIFKQDKEIILNYFIDNVLVEKDEYNKRLTQEFLLEEESKILKFNEKCQKYTQDQNNIQKKGLIKLLKIQLQEINKIYADLNKKLIKQYLIFSEQTICDLETFEKINFFLNKLGESLATDNNLLDFNLEETKKFSQELDNLFDRLSNLFNQSKQKALELSVDTKNLKELLEIYL
jgi:hypothetical protein